MRQTVTFYNSGYNLKNKLYEWSRKHNIIFAEGGNETALKIYFGREQDVTVFLLTWPHADIKPTVDL